MIGRVHSFQSLGTVDGPGVRYVVFLQGCPLQCGYCHNPDALSFEGGLEYTPNEIVQRVSRMREYLSGGVTVSGGEPLMQSEFVAALFAQLHREGIHTALDTSGCTIPAHFDALMEHTDLVLLDIKMNDDADYQEHIGLSIDAPMRFLSALERAKKKVWIRQVIVPGIHDRPGEMQSLAKRLGSYTFIERIELLPFRKLCLEKYQNMGRAFPMENVPEATPELIDRLSNELQQMTLRWEVKKE